MFFRLADPLFAAGHRPDFPCQADLTERGEQFVSSVAMRPHPSTLPSRPELASLSDRELEVLRMMVDGQRARAIAENLGISARTVETYRGRIMLKLGIDNLPALVKSAIRAGITSMSP